MNAEMFVQEQISDRRGYFRVDILTFQCQSNCKEKNRDARLVALSFWFAFTGVKRPSAFRPYMEHDPPSGRRHSRLSTRDALFREIEGCTSQHYHFDTRTIFVSNRECVNMCSVQVLVVSRSTLSHWRCKVPWHSIDCSACVNIPCHFSMHCSKGHISNFSGKVHRGG